MDICSAIANKNYVEFEYEGYPRKAIPFATGNHATTGNKVMRALQVAGGSSSGKFDFPKLFEVSKITNFKILDDNFDIPERFEKGDEHIHPIDCEL